MIRYIFFLCLYPFVLFAEPVTIRSGEHETFSRLVLGIGAGSQWSVTPTNDGYLLDIVGPIDGFETSEIFERIPTSRLSAVIQKDTDTLFLEVVCDCYVDAFLWQTGRLVLDIVDGENPNDVKVIPLSVDSPLRLPDLLADREGTPPLSSAFVIPMELQAQPRSPDIVEAEIALIEGLARAASQGFLDPAIQPVEKIENVEVADSAVAELIDLLNPPAVIGQPGVGITTASDREFALLGRALENVVAQQCLSGELFNIAAWGGEDAFHMQVADLAQGLAGEFGEEPREAQDALAQLYVHFGFGAEARSVVAADPALSQSRQVLFELAGVIDGYAEQYPLLLSQSGCPTPAALWAFFVNPTFLDQTEENAILQQFFALPQPLRGQIAPRFAQKFVSINDVDVASTILGASENQDVATSHDAQATRALIAEENDQTDIAIDVLSQEASDNARTSPESLVRLIELELEQGRVPKESDLALIASQRQEYRGMPVADELSLAEARGRIALGQFREALILMESRNDDDATSVVDLAYHTLTETALPGDFLELGYDDIPTAVSAQTENNMARRMIELGFPERAAFLLVGPATQDAATERRYLRAEAFIGTKNFTEAIDVLVGINDIIASELRARAYAGLGEYRAALEAIDLSEGVGDGGALQFRAAAWESLAIEDDEVLSSFAEAILAPDSTEPAETLSDRRAILAQSQESRRAVEGLLLRFDGATPQD